MKLRLGRSADGHRKPARAPLTGRTGARVVGSDLENKPAMFDPGSGPRILLFLTSSCEPCQPLWSWLESAGPVPLIVVTPGAATESRQAVRRLAPTGVQVIMSSEAWFDYRVSGAPWLVELDAGIITAESRASLSGLSEALARASDRD